jgi:glycosyltransferase involved in cell wall biosynthesis
MLDQITPLILTLDEAPNIGRALDRLTWARDIVVLDSFSSDATLEIVSRYPNARLVQRKFDVLATQWNFGLEQTGINSEWVLALDADYIVPEELTNEIGALVPRPGIDGYRASFIYCMSGRPLRDTLYPPVTVLFRRTHGRYSQDGHAHRVCLEGTVTDLSHRMLHDDRKSIRRWFRSQVGYMRLESAKLQVSRFADLPLQDRLRRLIVVAPIAAFFYCLFVRRNILDGRAGIRYAVERSVAEAILSVHLVRAMLSRD